MISKLGVSLMLAASAAVSDDALPQVRANRALFEERLDQTLERSPFLVVGSIKYVAALKTGIPVSFEDVTIRTDLVVVSVDVELSLRGDVPRGALEFFTYIFSAKSDRQLGWKPFVPISEARLVFPLRREGQMMRAMTDIADIFPRITTGLHRAVPLIATHVGLKSNPSAVQVRMIDKICSLMMTKGEGIDEIGYLDYLGFAAGDCLGWTRHTTHGILLKLSRSAEKNTAAYACSLLVELLDDAECLCVTSPASPVADPIKKALINAVKHATAIDPRWRSGCHHGGIR